MNARTRLAERAVQNDWHRVGSMWTRSGELAWVAFSRDGSRCWLQRRVQPHRSLPAPLYITTTTDQQEKEYAS